MYLHPNRPRASLVPAPRLCAALALIALLFGPTAAWAKKVVVLTFSGKGASLVRSTVVKTISERHQVVPQHQVESEAKKLGIGTDCNETTIIGLASVFAAEGVVCGSIAEAAGKRSLKLEVFNGGDGQTVEAIPVPVGRWGLEQDVLAQAKGKLNAALEKTWNWNTGGGDQPVEPDPQPGAAVEPDPQPEPAPQPEPDPEAQNDGDPAVGESLDTVLDAEGQNLAEDPLTMDTPVDPEPTGTNLAAADDTEDPLAASRRRKAAEAEAEANLAAKAEAKGRVEGRHALRLSVGPALRIRRNFKPKAIDPNTVRPERNAQKVAEGYQPDPAAGLVINAETYPGAWMGQGMAANFGLGLSYSFNYGPAWALANRPGDTHNIMQHTLEANLRFRYQINDSARLPLIQARFGFHYLTFKMNDTDVDALYPDVAYSSLVLGLGGEVGILPKWLHAFGHFDFMPVLAAGELADQDEFGSIAFSYGLDMGGGLRGALWGPIGWRLEIQYLMYSIGFKHELGDFTQWASKMSDSYLNGLLYLTFVN